MRIHWLTRGRGVVTLLAVLGSTAVASEANAATLPEHEPLSIVVVGDEVNPNNLPLEVLTQPDDVVAALQDPASGINVARVLGVASDCIDDATTALGEGVDVLVYFAHRSALTCSGTNGQPAFTQAVEEHLRRGGGVVVFHHGIYAWGGKEPILELLGGVATDISWQETEGQNVIAVAPDHFVASNATTYPESREFAAEELGIAAGTYPFFNNTPDERYPGLRLTNAPGEERTILFVSDYAGPQVLSYDLWRPGWGGHVVLYQPGEYQPNALDPANVNFQVLANAIYYTATTQEEPSSTTSTTTADDGADPTGDEDTSGGQADTGGPAVDDGPSDPSGNEETGAGGAGSDESETTIGEKESEGCSCHTSRGPAPFALALLVLGLFRRRRQSP